MEIAILSLLVVVIILSLFLILQFTKFISTKQGESTYLEKINLVLDKVQQKLELDQEFMNKNSLENMERISKSELYLNSQLTNFNERLQEHLSSNFIQLNQQVESNLSQINQRVLTQMTLTLDKNNQTFTQMLDRLNRMENAVNKNLTQFNEGLRTSLGNDFSKLNDLMEKRLLAINDKVNERLSVGFEKTNETFTNVLERLSKIDEAQRKIDSLSTEIVSLQDVLTDKKARGAFGEVQLHHILSSVFGESNDSMYRLNYHFEEANIKADAVLFAPEPLGLIVIDSRFPLENYRNMINRKLSESDRERYEKAFTTDMKKHIDSIAERYIISGVTSNQAFLFLPAEAIFAELNAYHANIIEYAYAKRVWITSPTTLMSTLTTVQAIVMNVERSKYASLIHEHLQKLEVEFNRYKERWNSLSTHMDTVSKDVKEIHTTTKKIGNEFIRITKVDKSKFNDKNTDEE